MAPRLQIQPSAPLLATPLTVDLPKKVRGKAGKAPSDTPAANEDVPKHFLSAAVTQKFRRPNETTEYTVAVVTVQGAGIYLYDLATNQPLCAWSVAPGTCFSSPARFLPGKSATLPSSALPDAGDDIDPSADDDGDEHKRLMNAMRDGDVFVPVCGVEEGKQLWRFRVSIGGKGGVSAVTKRLDYTFKHPIHTITPFVPHLSTPHLVITHSTGHLTVMPREHVPVSALPSPTFTPGSEEAVVWVGSHVEDVQSSSLEGTEDDMEIVSNKAHTTTLYILNLLTRQAAHILRVHTVTSSSSTPAVTNAEYVVPVKGTIAGVTFHAAKDRSRDVLGKLVILSPNNGSLKIFTVPTFGTSLILVRKIMIAPVLHAKEGLGRPLGVRVECLNADLVAVIRSKDSGEGYEDALTVLDMNYGTVQYEGVLGATGDKAEDITGGSQNAANGGQHAIWSEVCQTPASGATLLLAHSIVTAASPLQFKTNVTLTPYYAPKFTLASAIGRATQSEKKITGLKIATVNAPTGKQKRMHIAGEGLLGVLDTPLPVKQNESMELYTNTLKTLEEIDTRFVREICQSNLTATITNKKFDAITERWIMQKGPIGGAKKTVNIQIGKDVISLPSVSFSGVAINHVMKKVVEWFETTVADSGRETVFPRKFIMYLMRTKQMTSRSVPGGAVSLVTRAGDVALLEEILENVGDLDEKELVEAVGWVVKGGRDMVRKWWGELSAEEKEVRVGVEADGDAMEVDGKEGGESLTVGHAYLLRRVFAYARNDNLMTRALRKLEVEEVAVLFEWLMKEILGDGQSPNWWLFAGGDEADDGDEPNEWSRTIDTLTLLLDAHLSTLIFTPTLLPQLESLQDIITSHVSTYRSIEAKARGVVSSFHSMVEEQKKKEAEEKEKREERGRWTKEKPVEHRKEWKKLMGEVDSGEYEVEIYKFV
ncbi:hypothetical protein HDV00_011453 [Rhizophlyctis rosea]|nr:hypothetical protein HDV00_011453 [Rhizophlyctis rosea]